MDKSDLGNGALKTNTLLSCDSEARNYRDGLLAKLSNFRRDAVMCDVIIECESIEFPAHKLVLAASSQYFYVMFTSGLRETTARRVSIKNIASEDMNALLTYIYTGCILVTDENMQTVMSAAHLLQLNEVYQHCSLSLAGAINAHNFAQIWNIADMYDDAELRESVRSYTAVHLPELMRTDAENNVPGPFFTLPFDRVVDILSSKCVQSQDRLLEAILAWVRFDRTFRERLVPDLLPFVRCDFVTKDYLVTLLESDPFVNDSIELRLHLTIVQTAVERARMVVVGADNKHNLQIQSCCLWNSNWSSKHPSPIQRRNAGIASCFGLLYFVGGWSSSVAGRLLSATVQSYDITKKQVRQLQDLLTARSHITCAEMGGRIYAVGGMNTTQRVLAEVEMYDPIANTWQAIAPLCQARSGPSLSGVAGKLYAFGGWNGFFATTTSECYDPVANQWTKLRPAINGIACAAIGAVSTKLFLVGGLGCYPDSITVQCYETTKNEWREMKCLAPEDCRDVCCAAVSWNNRVYVVNSRGYLFVYDPGKDEWSKQKEGIADFNSSVDDGGYVQAVQILKLF